MMEKLDLEPPRRQALAAGVTETAGGALLALGALTPVAAAALSGAMFTAIRKVHFEKGLWNTGGGWEYNATLIAALAALVQCGPGGLSVDRALGIEKRGSGWALAAIAAGAAGSAVVIKSGHQEQAEPEHQPEHGQPIAA
jgi:putative oxidoreductase